jgi:hypothetical protein
MLVLTDYFPRLRLTSESYGGPVQWLTGTSTTGMSIIDFDFAVFTLTESSSPLEFLRFTLHTDVQFWGLE